MLSFTAKSVFLAEFRYMPLVNDTHIVEFYLILLPIQVGTKQLSDLSLIHMLLTMFYLCILSLMFL